MAVMKYAGRDCELSTSGRTASGEALPAFEAAREIVRRVEAAYEGRAGGVWTQQPLASTQRWGGRNGGVQYSSAWSNDCLRHWAPDGKCFYVDMSHVEVCTAPTVMPRTFAAQVIGALLVAEAARQRAEEEAEAGTTYRLSAANADALDPATSWGSHVNVSVSQGLWEDLFVSHEHPATLGFVASALAAAIPFFGAGYVLPLRDGSAVYSLSARAHHISQVMTLATTEAFRRGLLNMRREAHAQDCERLHLIGFDLAIASEALLCSFLQCVLAAAEDGFCRDALYDPVRALHAWSWQVDLNTGAMKGSALLASGERLTLPAYVRRLAAAFLEMCESGRISAGAAPQAQELLARIVELTRYAEEGSVVRCAPHLTWAAKLLHLVALGARRGVSFADPAIRLADHDFLDTCRERGAIWELWRRGQVDPLVSLADAEDTLLDGPAESSAWGRGRLIQRFRADISSVDWDHVELRGSADPWSARLRIGLPSLDSLSRERFERDVEQASSVEDLRRRLDEGSSGAASKSEEPMDDISRRLAVMPREDDGETKGARS
ncbi:MAG: proteasome accessory factor PafA2 family protein [Planctomycetes bacterium]|nr:proteasome accessory factor PafA2 family protein [Planctomycetota bacterium]